MVADKIYALLPASLPKHIGDLPSTGDNTVAILEYSGATGTEYFGTRDTASSVFEPIVKLVIRNKSYAAGEQWAELIKTTLHRYHDNDFISIMLVGTPIYLGRDEAKSHEFQVTFRTQIRSELNA